MGARSQRRPGGLLKDIRDNKASYLLALPVLLYVLVFQYMTYPYIAIAFQKFSYRTGLSFWNNQWIGLKNFEFFFKSPTFCFQLHFNASLPMAFGLTYDGMR